MTEHQASPGGSDAVFRMFVHKHMRKGQAQAQAIYRLAVHVYHAAGQSHPGKPD